MIKNKLMGHVRVVRVATEAFPRWQEDAYAINTYEYIRTG